MKPRFLLVNLPLAVLTLASSGLAASIIRNTTADDLISAAAWDDGTVAAPSAADTAVWNSTSLGGAQTLGGDASWGGIMIGSQTPGSGPLFTNVANPSAFTLTLGAGGIDLNDGESTNRGIGFESNTALFLAANQTWKLGDGGTSANIQVASVVSGSAALSITRSSGAANHVQLGGPNTFSGGLTVGPNAWLRLANSAAATTSLTSVTASATGTTTLTLHDGALVTSDGGTTRNIANTEIHLLGNVTFNQASGATGRIQMAGAWNLGGASRTITINKPSTSFGSGQEGLSVTSPAGFVPPSFSNGALTLATTSGTAANPAICRFTTTSFPSNGPLHVGDGVALTSQNGAFFGTAANSPALTLAAPDTRGGGVLQLGDGTNIMRGAQVHSLAGAGTISASNTTTGTPTGTLTINHGNGAEFSGAISQGGTGTIAVTKTGAGTQTLSGTNTYTGKTTISGGVLQFGKQASLYNNTPANWTDANIQVDSGATLALHVGGAGQFTSSDVASLAALGTATGGFRSGSRIGLDTTHAPGGSFTYSHVLANPNGGSNTLGLRKLGTGTLVLGQANTHTGGTFIDGGTLKVTLPAALGTGGTVTLAPGAVLDTDFSSLGAAGTIARVITNSQAGDGVILATPSDASQLSFSSGILTTFTGTVNVKPSPSSNARVDFNGLLGMNATIHIEAGATARLAFVGTYSDLTIHVAGTGGSGPGALRMQDTTLDESCAVNLTANASIGSFAPAVSTIDAVVSDDGNGRSLTKSGSSTLILTGQNTYTGNTLVNAGTLRITQPYLADASEIAIAADAVLDLSFNESSGHVSDTVQSLVIGGVQQPAGVYGATGSGAATVNDTNFAGVGTLTVLSGPAAGNDYASWAAANGISGQPFEGDFDNDGITNGMEYALGRNPTTSSQPAGTLAGSTISFVKGADAIANADVSWEIETSTTLAPGSWNVEVTQAAGDPAASISYTFPPGGPAKKFARLKVVQQP